MSLTDQVILITGAGGGLGGTAALALAKRGAKLILLDKSIPKLEKIYDAIVNCGGTEPVMYPFDLAGASEAQYQEMADAIGQHYGSLQGLLHSAVEFSAYTPLAIHKTQDWGHALNVNLNAPFLLSRVLLPLMQKSPHASIVFTSDSAARQAQAYSGAYGVSKIALEGFAKILAEELEAGQKIRVNTLVPGPVDSPLRKKAYPAEDKSKLPPMSSLDPIYCYLFDTASIGITGQIIDAQTFTFE
ncbi:SDR family NAD(P)-dependent oxidoreductase [Methylomonas sp. LL1]|uniref:SDR family NAD(P)-dependent oxidoreductase n=1 Tax=Methylomonas sp. LL1 TaxID=2785785 RepID=UPI0018C42C6C|nr:SDR family NAD(P)-dependent oxidoreductase [Methylomonas sp. LL1]QPK65407.1 SDR family NAD(P)-dependent oxidoreductase [Methylomonas sp. LL1]